MTDKYSDLKKAALAVQATDTGNAFSEAWMRFDDLASPAIVLAILADLEGFQQGADVEAREADAGRKEVKRLTANNELMRARSLDLAYCTILAQRRELIAERDSLKAEAESLRKDGGRYRWLRDYHIGDDPESINLEPAGRRGLGQAIDAAMKKELKQ